MEGRPSPWADQGSRDLSDNCGVPFLFGTWSLLARRSIAVVGQFGADIGWVREGDGQFGFRTAPLGFEGPLLAMHHALEEIDPDVAGTTRRGVAVWPMSVEHALDSIDFSAKGAWTQLNRAVPGLRRRSHDHTAECRRRALALRFPAAGVRTLADGNHALTIGSATTEVCWPGSPAAGRDRDRLHALAEQQLAVVSVHQVLRDLAPFGERARDVADALRSTLTAIEDTPSSAAVSKRIDALLIQLERGPKARRRPELTHCAERLLLAGLAQLAADLDDRTKGKEVTAALERRASRVFHVFGSGATAVSVLRSLVCDVWYTRRANVTFGALRIASPYGLVVLPFATTNGGFVRVLEWLVEYEDSVYGLAPSDQHAASAARLEELANGTVPGLVVALSRLPASIG